MFKKAHQLYHVCLSVTTPEIWLSRTTIKDTLHEARHMSCSHLECNSLDVYWSEKGLKQNV